MIIIKIIFFPVKLVFLALIYLYKFLISPILPKTCRFVPTCSTYAVLAIKEYGVIKGTILGAKRILRCNPHSKCGYDFLPQNIKGDSKWII